MPQLVNAHEDGETEEKLKNLDCYVHCAYRLQFEKFGGQRAGAGIGQAVG